MTTEAQETPRGVSEKKIAANRRNAQLSTGPRTPAGKKRAAQNSLKHGLFTRPMLTLDESARGFLRLWRELHNEFQPAGTVEKLLVERVASVLWRMRRMGRVEADVLALKEGDGRSMYRWGQAFLGDSFGPGPGAMPRLSRYETALERSLYRALESLRRAQEARKSREFDANRREFDAVRHQFDAVREAVSGRPNGTEVPGPQPNGGG